MQDRYAGDVGDFAKLGLIRALVLPGCRLKPGIVWYLAPDESGNNDGRYTEYPALRSCDEDLFDALQPLVRRANRTVQDLTCSVAELLPDTTLYHDRLGPGTDRSEWLKGASRAVSNCDLLFLDPDNGLEVPSTPVESKRACKYAFFEDLEVLDPGGRKSLIVYQSLTRQGTAQEQAERRLKDLESLGRTGWALRFRRLNGRLFLVLPGPDAKEDLWSRTEDLLKGPWGQPTGHKPPPFEVALRPTWRPA